MIRLKELRKKAGLSQSDFAKKINVAQNTVSNWENGNRVIDSEKAITIASYFGVTTDYLLGKEDEPTPKKDSLDDVQFAFYGDVSDFTEEERRDLANFVEFIRAKRKGKSKE